jgi:hypothetical protein
MTAKGTPELDPAAPKRWLLAECPSGEDGIDYHLAAIDGPDSDTIQVRVIEEAPVVALLRRAQESLLDYGYGKITDDSRNNATQRLVLVEDEIKALLAVVADA